MGIKHQLLFGWHYNKRQNAESTFSALKRKLNDYCRYKSLVSRENEILCKIVCYNIWVLSQALLSDDVHPLFMSN